MEEALNRGHQLIYRLELIQYQYFNGRPLWTQINFENLKLFMAYTYYGSPFSADENSDDINTQINNINKDIFDYYKNDEKQNITDMINIIKTKAIKNTVSNINVGITITHSICQMKCNSCQDFPAKDIHQWYLLRVKQDDTFLYVDFHHKRMYENWNDYVNNNTLPEGYMFYPESGFYDESKYLTQHLTPSSRQSEKILKAIDLVGQIFTFVSGVCLGAGLVFPVLSPVLIPSATILTSFSTWEAGRQIFKLTDLNQHSESLISKKAKEHWMNLAIASLGIITAPLNATVRTLKLSNSLDMTTKIGKSLCFAQTSACLTHCSLEIVQLASKILNKGQVTFNDIMCLRLDLFIVGGLLLPIQYIQELIECIVGGIWARPIFNIMSNVYFSTSQHILDAACFIQQHFVEFSSQIVKFIKNNLTLSKLCCAIKQFNNFKERYKKHLRKMTPDELLAHVVNDTLDIPHSMKSILSGDHMKALLRNIFPAHVSDISFVKFCVKYVYDKAHSLFEMFRDVITTCKSHGKNNYIEIEKQFCQQYNLNQCTMKEYILNAICEIKGDRVSFLTAYNRHCSLFQNKYKDLIFAGCSIDIHNIETFFRTGTGNELEEDICKNFAQAIDQCNDNNSRDYSFMQPERDISMLFSHTIFSIKLIIFTTNTHNGVRSLNAYIYHNSHNRMA